MSAYPKNLSYFVNRISNYSQNTIKILPYRTDAVPSSQIVTVDIPTNALNDLSTFAFHFSMSTTAVGASNFAAPPQNIESIIDRVSIDINGDSLSASANQNYVFNSLLPLMGGTDLVNKRKIYQNGGDQAAPTAVFPKTPFVISHWMGFLGSLTPDVLDTSKVGSVRVNIHLANANCLIPAVATGTGFSVDYTLSDLYFTINTLAIQDGVYYPLQNRYLQSGQVMEIPFDNYHTSLFNTAQWDDTHRFGIRTSCLDWLAAVYPKNYNKCIVLNTDSKRGGMFDSSLSGLGRYSFSVNGVSYPQYKAKVDEAYTHTLNALQQTHDVSNGISPNLNSRAKWINNFGVLMTSFSFPAGPDERVLSGLNTEGQTYQCAVETESDSTSTDTPSYCLMIAKTTSVLVVGEGQAIAIEP